MEQRGIPSREQMLAALIAREGKDNVEKLQAATVAVCGLGGLGSNVAIALARTGVGKLILVDFDVVDVSNLHRQQYKACQVGMEKSTALAENLKEIAPYTDFETHQVRISEDNVIALVGTADVVCECFDNAEAKAMLVNAVLEHNAMLNAGSAEKKCASFEKLQYLVSASGMAGFADANSIQTRKVSKYFYLCGDGRSDVNDGIGLVAPRVMACAAHEAQTVVRLLCGMPGVSS